MTAANTSSKIPQARGRFRLPDMPECAPDEVTQYDQLFHRGQSSDLSVHLGNHESALVSAYHWSVSDTDFGRHRARYPDLMVAFGVDPAAYRASNDYIVSEQGEPLDSLLEVASQSAGDIDVGTQRDYYPPL